MNKVILIGRLTRDPELRMTQSGIASCNFSLAVQRPFTNQEGQRDADFVNCVVWRKQAENLTKYCSKGTQIALEGRIQTRNYDAEDGSKRYVTEVVADNVQFLDSRSNRTDNMDSTPAVTPSSFSDSTSNFDSAPQTTDVKSDPFADFGSSIEINDDELPF